MKVKSLEVKNIGIIADAKIEINKKLNLFYGEIRNGKTTILNSVKWVMGGSFPQDIIRHGADEASICLEFEGGSISRSFYRSKDGVTRDRPVSFVLNGKPVAKPATEIKKLLNPFLLNQNFFADMSLAERKRHLLEVFEIDTSEIDKEIEQLEKKASYIRSEVKGFGQIDTTPVELPDVTAAKVNLKTIKESYLQECEAWEENRQVFYKRHGEMLADLVAKKESIDRHNDSVVNACQRIDEIDDELADMQSKISKLQEKRAQLREWVAANPQQISPEIMISTTPPKYPYERPQPPDTTALEEQISQAAAQQVRHEGYLGRLERQREKDAKVAELAKLTEDLKQCRAQKLLALHESSESCAVAGLEFREDGGIYFEDTALDMLATSQMMRLSSELSGLYPEGLGLELIDHGESLGLGRRENVLTLVDRAASDERNIMVTVVGDVPAELPEDIGVWVVEGGEVKQ